MYGILGQSLIWNWKPQQTPAVFASKYLRNEYVAHIHHLPVEIKPTLTTNISETPLGNVNFHAYNNNHGMGWNVYKIY